MYVMSIGQKSPLVVSAAPPIRQIPFKSLLLRIVYLYLVLAPLYICYIYVQWAQHGVGYMYFPLGMKIG